MRLIIYFLFFSISLNVFSKGFVILDSKTHEPLVFATVLYKSDKLRGKITDIDGKFSIPTENLKYIRLSYTGYQILKLTPEQFPSNGIFYLTAKAHQALEVLVYPKKNPAHIIMDSVRKHAPLHNPYNLAYFECQEYNKVKIGYGFEASDLDTTPDLFVNTFTNADPLFTENFYTRYHRKGAGVKLVLNATQSSGFKKKALSFPVEDIQPFHFYEKNMIFLDENYFNPIYDDNFNTYRFLLTDSLTTNEGIVYQISFEPRFAESENSLRGILFINKTDYAINSVKASTRNSRKLRAKIEQKYEKQQNDFWFPVQHNFVMETEDFLPGIKMTSSGRTYISHISTRQKNEVEFGDLFMEWNENMKVNDSLYFALNRPIGLSTREQNSYYTMDTLLIEKGYSLDLLPELFEKLQFGLLPLSYVDLDLFQLYNQNKVEGNRFGLGLYTNEDISNRFSVGGFWAYGSKDEELKYGASFKLNLTQSNFWKLQLDYSNDFKLSGEKSLLKDFIVYDFTKYEEMKASTSFSLKYFDFTFSLSYQDIDPFIRLVNESNTYQVTEAGFELDLDFNRRYISAWLSPYSRVNYTSSTVESIFPKLVFNYTEGFDNLLGGDYSYSKFNLKLKNNIVFTEVGNFYSCLDFGLVDREISYAKLFSGNSIYAETSFIYFDDVFQTIQTNEFSNSKYVNGFFRFEFVPIPLSVEYFRPQISLAHNMSYGELPKKLKDENPHLQDLSKGYHESGFIFSDIVRYPFMNLIYLGAGASAFLRWGEYAYEDFDKNLNLKLRVRLSF